MIEIPRVPENPEDLPRFLRDYLGQMSNVMQALASGQAYPQSKTRNKQQFWEDELTSFNSARVTGANQPTWAAILGDIYGWRFSATTAQELWPSPIHLTHRYRPNSKIYPHIHWVSTGTNTGVVRWGVEYTFAKGHSQGANSVFPAPQIMYLEQAATGTPYEHMIVEASDLQAIDSTNIEVDALVLTRVFRDAAHPNDTCTDPIFGLMFDMHYQTSYWATKNKSPNFYD